MELALRIPSWLATPTATVLLNGAPHATPRKGSFLKIKRLWHSGDSISLFLPMGFRATEYVGKNQIAGHRRVAYEYGPVSQLYSSRSSLVMNSCLLSVYSHPWRFVFLPNSS